jgi:hypothetical protein
LREFLNSYANSTVLHILSDLRLDTDRDMSRLWKIIMNKNVSYTPILDLCITYMISDMNLIMEIIEF